MSSKRSQTLKSKNHRIPSKGMELQEQAILRCSVRDQTVCRDWGEGLSEGAQGASHADFCILFCVKITQVHVVTTH